MVTRGEGLYRPSPGPQGSDPGLTQWCQREFDDISRFQSRGRAQWSELDVLQKLPSHPREGQICYFVAGVVNVGSLKGFYGYDGTAWAKF